MVPRSASLAERLDYWSEPYAGADTCRLWRGGLSSKGYGLLKWKGRRVRAHRATWECERGPIPEGMEVCHHCDTPACRNIDHLFLGTQADNMADMVAKGRQGARGGPPGEAHGGAKLTEAEVIQIRAIPRGVPYRLIGSRYGISGNTVGKIRRGQRWRHLAASATRCGIPGPTPSFAHAATA